MDRRDYILRMIEQLGQALIALRNRILGRDIEGQELRGSLSDVARQGGLDMDLARAMTSETLLMMVAPGGEVDPGRCWLLAELFYLEGLEADLAGDAGLARSSLERAGFLFGMLQPVAGNVAGLEEAPERVADIERRLERLPRPPGRTRGPVRRSAGRAGRPRVEGAPLR